MMTLLRGLHSIAAQRGDGLRPELLGMITPSPVWSDIQEMGNAKPAEHPEAQPGEEPRGDKPTAEIVRLPVSRR